MNKYYKAEIIERMFTPEEFEAFHHNYCKARIPKPYSIWGDDEDRADYLRWLESRKTRRR